MEPSGDERLWNFAESKVERGKVASTTVGELQRRVVATALWAVLKYHPLAIRPDAPQARGYSFLRDKAMCQKSKGPRVMRERPRSSRFLLRIEAKSI